MEYVQIIIAMVLTIVRIVYYIVQAVLVMGVVGIILVAAGAGKMYYERWKENREEASDDGGDFEESRVPDAANKRLYTAGVIPKEESERYWAEIERLNDTAILENTKEL